MRQADTTRIARQAPAPPVSGVAVRVLHVVSQMTAGAALTDIARLAECSPEDAWAAVAELRELGAIEERATNRWRLTCAGALGLVAGRYDPPRQTAPAVIAAAWVCVGLLWVFLATLVWIDIRRSPLVPAPEKTPEKSVKFVIPMPAPP